MSGPTSRLLQLIVEELWRIIEGSSSLNHVSLAHDETYGAPVRVDVHTLNSLPTTKPSDVVPANF